jgi:hypothetical protein
MSLTFSAPTTRQARMFIKQATAGLLRKERGPDRGVRRHSYDVDDRRAQVFAPIGDGTKHGALDWIDAFLETAREYDDFHRGERGRRPLGFTGIRVLEILLGRRGVPIDFRTGRLDPAIDTIARIGRLVRATVIRALARLREHGFLHWVRRTRPTGNAGHAGPQREQITNAYYFDLAALPAKVRQRFRDLLARRALRRVQRATPPPRPVPPASVAKAPAPLARDPLLAAALARMGALVAGASPDDGQYPAQGNQG